MLQVAFAGGLAVGMEPSVRRRVSVPCNIVVVDGTDPVPALATAEVLVSLAFTAEMGHVAERLKLLQIPGAGLDRIERSALPRGAMLANAYGHENGIAEYVLGAMLALTRDFATLDAELRRGEWPSQWRAAAGSLQLWPELTGKTVAILGYGRIGRAVAQRARAFGMKIVAVRRNPQSSASGELAEVYGPERMDTLLQSADYVVIALPATPATIGAIGERQLSGMKPTAFLINIGRAEIVDQDALYHALSEHRIAGAALDVWYRYPAGAASSLPASWPFHELPNVLMTPHIAGATHGMLEARAELIAENVRRIALNEPPLNLVSA